MTRCEGENKSVKRESSGEAKETLSELRRDFAERQRKRIVPPKRVASYFALPPNVFNHKTISIAANFQRLVTLEYLCDDIVTQRPVCTLEWGEGILGLYLLGHSGELTAEGDEFR
jgi:hypothetical protein